MLFRRCVLTLAALPLLLVPMACATSPDEGGPIEARDGEASPEGRRIEIAVPAEHANKDEIHEIANFLESQADVAGAKVEVRKDGAEGGASLAVLMWGQDMPTDEEFVDLLGSEFPYLAADSIAVTAVDMEAEALPGHDEPKDPDELREKVIADLRAQGVEGEIDVEIIDHPNGEREVKVQVHDDKEG